MRKFIEFLEARVMQDKDSQNLQSLGLNPGSMRIIPRRRKEYEDHEILNSEHCYLRIPERDDPSWNQREKQLAQQLRPHNGQIVAVEKEYFHSSRSGVWITLLDNGRVREGTWTKVPFDWLKPVKSKKGQQHASWLGNTFFNRSTYVSPDEARSGPTWKLRQNILISPEDTEQLYDQLNSISNVSPHMREMIKNIKNQLVRGDFNVGDLSILADMADDEGQPELSKLIREIIEKAFK